MPARIDRDWNIVLPKGESFGLVLRNYGTAKVDESFRALLAVQDRNGEVQLIKETEPDADGVFRFALKPGDTANMAEGAYLYDIVITQTLLDPVGETGDGAGTKAAQTWPDRRYTMFAPEMRKFVIGRVADDGV